MYKDTTDQIENIGERLKNVRQYLIMTQDADQFAKSFSINTIVKAKLELLQQQFVKQLENTRNDFIQKASATIDLL